MPWARRVTKRIPPQTSPKQTLEMNDYSMGFNSFIGNDAFPVKNGGGNMWRVAKNARITTLGEYGTRRGVDFHSDAAGETLDDAILPTNIIDECDATTGWTATNGTLSLDTTIKYEVTGSLKIDAVGGQTTATFNKLNFAPTVDLSSTRGFLDFYSYFSAETQSSVRIYVRMSSDATFATNYIEYTVTAPVSGSWVNTTWLRSRVDLSTAPSTTVGTVNRAAIKSIAFRYERSGVTSTWSATTDLYLDYITNERVNTPGEADFNYTQRLAQKFTASANGRLTKLITSIKNDLSGTGAVMCEVYTNNSGVPGTKLATSSIAASAVISSFAEETFYFNEAPSLSTGSDYWFVLYVQQKSTGSYTALTNTIETGALLSTDIGTTWASQSYTIDFKEYYATSQPVKGLFRAYKTDGTKVTLFVAGTTLYSVNNSTGALTVVKSSLSASATDYRFAMVNDIVYYVNGFDGYRKWDFSTESQVSATNYTTIAEHKGLMFLGDKTDPNKVVFSNFAAYETFTATDFIYVPAPKTGDPVSGLVSLNGYLFIYTLNNKYILAGDDRDSFSLGEAPDQRGTFTQETVTKDKNFMYYLSNDGVYRSNGSEAQLLSENVYQEVFDLNDKPECFLQVNGGRLYLWYQTSGSSVNDECLVWNLNYSGKSDTVESRDTQSYGSRAFAAYDDNNALIVGSSLVGQVWWQELPTNDYTNAGGLIEFELSTPYMPFASPAVLKEIRYWEPRFGAQSDSYTIACEYAYDLRDNWNLYANQNVQGEGYTYGTGSTNPTSFGSGTQYGTTSELQAYLYVPGEYRRIALRYKHYATRQPHTFLGHTLVVQTRRIR